MLLLFYLTVLITFVLTYYYLRFMIIPIFYIPVNYFFKIENLWLINFRNPRTLMYIVSLLISSTVIHNIFFSSSQLTLYNYITESIWYLIALLLIIFSHSTLFSEKIIKINNEANSITNKESKIKEINISDIVKKLINLRWFHGERIEENLNNLLNYKLEKIKKNQSFVISTCKFK